MRLYGYWRSSSTWRVRIALAHKGLDYENVPVHLLEDGGRQRKPEYTAKNPSAQVPLLEWDETVNGGSEARRLAQSMAILDYLERTHPEPALLPDDPYLRARAIELAEIVNAGIQPMQNLSLLQRVVKEFGADKLAWGRGYIEKGLWALQTRAGDVAGDFLVGDQLTWADLLLVPQLYNARRFQVNLEPFDLLTRIEARCAELPAFVAAHPDQMPDAQPA